MSSELIERVARELRDYSVLLRTWTMAQEKSDSLRPLKELLAEASSVILTALDRPAPVEGQVATLPDIGTNPMAEDGDRECWRDRLKEAYVRQQKGVPDQTGLVWRADLGKMHAALQLAEARADLWLKDRLTHSAPKDAGEHIEDALARAYTQGASDVHEEWKRDPTDCPRGDPDFAEAASDYARDAMDPFSSAAPSPPLQSKDASHD